MRFMVMEDLVAESGISRFTLMPELRTGKLHGVQRKKGGTWRVAEPCFQAWMLGDALRPPAGGGVKLLGVFVAGAIAWHLAREHARRWIAWLFVRVQY